MNFSVDPSFPFDKLILLVHRPKTCSVTKNQRCNKKLTLWLFGPIALKGIEYGVLVSEPRFYSFQRHRTKNKEVLIFRYTEFALQQISKGWSNSATRNSALKTPYPPLPYIFWTVRTRGFSTSHKKNSTPIKKNWENRNWVIRFLAIFGDFWGLQRFSRFECFGWILCILSLCIA